MLLKLIYVSLKTLENDKNNQRKSMRKQKNLFSDIFYHIVKLSSIYWITFSFRVMLERIIYQRIGISHLNFFSLICLVKCIVRPNNRSFSYVYQNKHFIVLYFISTSIAKFSKWKLNFLRHMNVINMTLNVCSRSSSYTSKQTFHVATTWIQLKVQWFITTKRKLLRS